MSSSDAPEICRWAAFLAVDAAPSSARNDSVRALIEAAEGRAEPLHRAWILALDRLARGRATHCQVALLRSALDEVSGRAAA